MFESIKVDNEGIYYKYSELSVIKKILDRNEVIKEDKTKILNMIRVILDQKEREINNLSKELSSYVLRTQIPENINQGKKDKGRRRKRK